MAQQQKKRNPSDAPKPTHEVDNAHETPEQAAMDAQTIEREQDNTDWVRPSALDAPPARPGMVQRWIRTTLGGDDDPRNWQKAMREGWRPRQADTVEHAYMATKTRLDGIGDVIGVQGLILCEMPEHKARQRRQFYDDHKARQAQSVKNDLLKVQQPGEPINVDHNSRVEQGRRPEVAAD